MGARVSVSVSCLYQLFCLAKAFNSKGFLKVADRTIAPITKQRFSHSFPVRTQSSLCCSSSAADNVMSCCRDRRQSRAGRKLHKEFIVNKVVPKLYKLDGKINFLMDAISVREGKTLFIQCRLGRHGLSVPAVRCCCGFMQARLLDCDLTIRPI